MPSDLSTRRLSAIMVVDMVGYSRLVEADEAATLAAAQTLHREIVEPLLEQNYGRLVKQTGDGFIAEFASVVDAVVCAVALQNGVAGHQSEVSSDRRLIFRIGINLGDVVVKGDDLLGDGVNVAARLEQLCDPGGVLVSGTAYDHLQGKLGLPLDFVGERRVKNIARPVRTYRVRLDGKSPSWKVRLRRHKRLARATGALVGLLVIGALLAWWANPSSEVVTKPSIAVLPFVALSGDESAQRLAKGVTEDITTDLARYRGFDVIAHQSVAEYAERPVDVREVGHDLKVSYVLQGSVQSQDERIRISAQLANSETGALTWSERWDRPIGDFFAVQSELSGQVATRLGGLSGTVLTVEREVAKRKPPNSLTAYDVYLLALEAQGEATQQGIEKAITLFKQSLSIDPSFSRAWTNLSFSYTQLSNWTGAEDLRRLAREAAQRAVEFDPLDGNAHAALAEANAGAGDVAQAEAEYDKALELNPNSADILTLYSAWASVFGKTQQGVEAAERALRLNPNASAWTYPLHRWAFFIAGKYDEALAMHERRSRASYGKADFLEGAAILAAVGRQPEAESLAQKAMALFPNISVEAYMSGSSPSVEERTRMADAMKKAGFPTCASEDFVHENPQLERLPECSER